MKTNAKLSISTPLAPDDLCNLPSPNRLLDFIQHPHGWLETKPAFFKFEATATMTPIPKRSPKIKNGLLRRSGTQ
jgi:hypothetical protein